MFTTLITAEELAPQLGSRDLVVFDCRHDLSDYGFGRRAYLDGHIPGALFLHLDEDLSGTKTGRNGRHPLPHPRTFALRLGALGVGNTTQVVAYDSSGGCYAARLWWMMRWLGHSRVAVLDGGWQEWNKLGLEVSTAVSAPQPTTFTGRLHAELAVDASFVAGHLGDSKTLVVDARSPDRFRGENETIDPVGGHIPGAANRFYRLNLDEGGSFKPPERLRGEFEAVLQGREAEAVVHQCGSGVTACHNLLAMERAGLTGSKLYAGSWSEWISDRSRPVER